MVNTTRKFSWLDNLIIQFDKTVRLGTQTDITTQRCNPADAVTQDSLSPSERKHAASLMRVNHVGEVCAQALYQGQALTSRNVQLREKLAQAAKEEVDHLVWCRQRIEELNSHTSFLNPLWYIGSLSIGMMAGLAKDSINLGFLAETEHQVEQHLSDHLQQLPAKDVKSRVIVQQMQYDEQQHALMAEQAGAIPLPATMRFIMRATAKIMTTVAYWI